VKLSDQELEAINAVLTPSEGKEFASVIEDDAVQGWSVFDANGAAVASNGISQTVMAVCSNILDMANFVGDELGESNPRPALSFAKRNVEMFTLPLEMANVLVVKDKSSGFRREFRNGR